MRKWYVFISAAIIFLPGCKSTVVRQNSSATSYVRASRAELSSCSGSSKGWLAYITDEKKFYSCDGSSWGFVDITGPTGSAGTAGAKGDKGDTGGYSAYANGVIIGPLISVTANNSQIVVLSSTKYLMLLNSEGTFMSSSGGLYYASADCTGDAFIRQYSLANGSVFSDGGSTLFYVPKNAMPQANVVYNSYLTAGVCTAATATVVSPKKVLPNNSSVTGVSASSFNQPITIE